MASRMRMGAMRMQMHSMMEAEPDPRPVGSLLFADPSTAEFPRHIHTFNEPFSPRSTGEQHGVRSMTGRRVPWNDMHGETTHGAWEEMSRKRGVLQDEEDDD